jgi:hypothetical protein
MRRLRCVLIDGRRRAGRGAGHRRCADVQAGLHQTHRQVDFIVACDRCRCGHAAHASGHPARTGLLGTLNVSAADAALRELIGDPPAPDHTAEVQALRRELAKVTQANARLHERIAAVEQRDPAQRPQGDKGERGPAGLDGLGVQHTGGCEAGKVYRPGMLYVRNGATWMVNEAGNSVLFTACGSKGERGAKGARGDRVTAFTLKGSRLSIMVGAEVLTVDLMPLA